LNFTKSVLTIQVNFTDPKQISESMIIPDKLFVKFPDFPQNRELKSTSEVPEISETILAYNLPQQITQQLYVKIQELEKTAESSMQSFAIGTIVGNVIFSFSLKQMWNLLGLL
jgi:hypothetical protein